MILVAFFCALLSVNAGQAADPIDLPGTGTASSPATSRGADTIDWDGWYWGFQLGYAHASHDVLELEPGPGFFGNFNGVGIEIGHHAESVIPGIHVGIRHTFNNLVLGLEGDFNLASGLSDTLGPQPINASLDNNTLEFNARWQAGARATIGIPHDNWLVYALAGVDWLNADLGLNSDFPMNATENHTLHGLTLGAGVNWQINERTILGLEYRHTDFGDTRTDGNITSFGGQTFFFENKVAVDTVMLKLSFRL